MHERPPAKRAGAGLTIASGVRGLGAEQVPKKLQAALPFKSKPKLEAPRKRKTLEQKARLAHPTPAHVRFQSCACSTRPPARFDSFTRAPGCLCRQAALQCAALHDSNKSNLPAPARTNRTILGVFSGRG